MFELIFYYVSVWIINFISTYLCYGGMSILFNFFLGGICKGVGGQKK